jgi:hypothetical protein
MLQRTPPRNGDLVGKLIAMSEQLKAATGLDIVGAVSAWQPDTRRQGEVFSDQDVMG